MYSNLFRCTIHNRCQHDTIICQFKILGKGEHQKKIIGYNIMIIALVSSHISRRVLCGDDKKSIC